MKAKFRQSGVTLTEMTIVVAVASLLATLGMPAVRTLFNSLESSGSVVSMISTSLASARAIAAREQRYAGIRFQKAHHLKGPLEADQYMIFIIQDPNIMAHGFRAVEGMEPMKLPDSIGVMDSTIVIGRNVFNPANPTQQVRLDDPLFGGDARINDDFELTDTTTFSIIFSPSGKLVIHGVRVRNRDGQSNDSSADDIFNTENNVSADIAMFYQDDYFNPPPEGGLGPEPSRNSFIIYEKEEFRQVYEQGQAYSGYLYRLLPDALYINPYTGTIIKR